MGLPLQSLCVASSGFYDVLGSEGESPERESQVEAVLPVKSRPQVSCCVTTATFYLLEAGS